MQAERIGALIVLSALACGPISTQVGAELPAEAGPGDATTIDANPPCRGDLSNIGTNDFRVSFGITTSQSQFSAIANQRSVCAHGVYWDIRMTSGGLIAAETDDAVHYTPLTSAGARINDGRLHDVVLQRSGGTLTVFVDGAPSGSAASLASFGALAPLRLRSDVCTTAIDGTNTFVGAISNVCLSSP
jgi:hypothetical protein